MVQSKCGHAHPGLQSLTVSVGEIDPLKRRGMDRAALCMSALYQPALPVTTLYSVQTRAHLRNPMHCLQP